MIIKILAISGSLRRNSLNTRLLNAATILAPECVEIVRYEGLGTLPLFNPDLEGSEPSPVFDFRASLKGTDGLLIASPEYAHGVTGVLKNALDWVVGSGEFVGKPVALLNASSRATLAYASLRETLNVMDARLITEASRPIPLVENDLDVAGIVAHPEKSKILLEAIIAFARAIEAHREMV